ncbi:hypothetical protein EDC01DRAFT_672977 [Geopyxis carbonaria]|nr:hypothetical protein EDC01DRAFT_672977 [Geopyxis carbonaria]
MDYSTMSQSSLFGNSTFAGNSTMGPTSTPDKNKEKRFYDWHQKQGITAPQDYPVYAAQPAPFASIPQNPTNYPTAASPYIQKVMTYQQVDTNSGPEGEDLFGSEVPERRKPTLKKTTSSTSPPTPAGQWPKAMFGSRAPTRTRSRTSSTPDINLGHDASANNPPTNSIYDDLRSDPIPTESKPLEPTMTPTQVRVANFSEERFSDLIRSLRRYYGPILESYSGLPESESKFPDPEIIPREKLDSNIARMIQPLTGSDGGPGPWVRITFRDREAAERAVAGAAKNELVIGGRIIYITFWDLDPIVPDQGLPFQMMDIDAPGPGTSGHHRRRSRTGMDAPIPVPVTDPAANGLFSEHMPGAKLAVPQQVVFEKQEGWFNSATNALIGSANRPSVLPAGQSGGISGVYNYIMNDVIGFKYL